MNATLMLLLLLTQTPARLEKSKSPNETEDAAMRAAVTASAKEFAGRCEFILSAADKKNLVLYPEPILRWSNPTAGTVLGEVFVWTDNGRPAVIGSWYRWFSPDWGRTFEVCSLSQGGIEGRIKDVRFWNPVKAGLMFQPLKNVDAPVTSHAARLVQMRRLAKDFSASLVDDRGDAAGVQRQLRLLTQPIFRYPVAGENSNYADGALFAFVEGTDPEVFLLIEATPPSDTASWRYALVRMNSDALQVVLREDVVWTAPKIEYPLNLSQAPYSLFTSDAVLKESASRDKPPVSRPQVIP
ncbi:MAG: hypothetical protein JWP89_6837 [Schlesneria sp.]|nr:hypothetical protein [Schlesneria sp.]